MRRQLRNAGLAALLILFVLPWYFYFGPRSPVIGQIVVEGTETVPPREVARKLSDLKGKPFSGFSTKRAAEEVLKDPRIEKTAVRFAFSNKLVVRVKEKKFDYLLVSNELFGLSEKMEIFPLDDSVKPGDRLVVSGCATFGGWYYRPVKSPVFGRVSNFLSSVHRQFPEFLDRVSQLDFEDPYNVKAYLQDGGVEINLGTAPYEPKLLLLKQMAASGFPAGNLDLRQKAAVYGFVGTPQESK
ncbi:MAG: FtsQ-type POTRA domain-containing protein [candidate division Zixibacteria bacterium]|nr:FtsQ-type POTRA domain-containing protein [candidate division Zixibacteria bacterium]